MQNSPSNPVLAGFRQLPRAELRVLGFKNIAEAMALHIPLRFRFSLPLPPKEDTSITTLSWPVPNLGGIRSTHSSLRFSPATHRKPPLVTRIVLRAVKDDDDVFVMDDEEREEWRRKIRAVMESTPDVEEEVDEEERKRKMRRLMAEYPLVVEEDDPDWPEDADGWGFNFDQFFNKITIKNVKKEEKEDCDRDEEEIVWQDDDYIRPIRDVTAREWEDTVFRDFNPLVILVHNRYKRPRENEKARNELEKAVQMFWESGLPSPRCVAIDAVVEQDLVSALKVSIFPEILFTKAGKILHRDKVVRTADEWSKTMAFFYYKAVRPPFLDKTAGQSPEKIPSLSQCN